MVERDSYAIVDRTGESFDVVLVLDTHLEAEEIAAQLRRKGRVVQVRQYRKVGAAMPSEAR
jgi:hypothetical protein